MSGKTTELGGYQKDRSVEMLKNDLYYDHWAHVFNWAGLSIDKLAQMYNCTMDDVRRSMAAIAKEHPKPKPVQKWKHIESRGPCRTCGRVIGFARTRNGKLMPVNLKDFSTHWGCEKPGKRKKKKG